MTVTRQLRGGVLRNVSSEEAIMSLIHVLIVEDIHDVRQMYALCLRSAGFRVSEAGDGFQAIEIAANLQPDVIIMDLGLPRLDGWEATRTLKNCPETRNIPVVALTALTDAVSHRRAKSAGCACVYGKSSDPLELVWIALTALEGGVFHPALV